MKGSIALLKTWLKRKKNMVDKNRFNKYVFYLCGGINYVGSKTKELQLLQEENRRLQLKVIFPFTTSDMSSLMIMIRMLYGSIFSKF